MWVWVCRGSGSRFVTAGCGDLRLLFFFFFFFLVLMVDYGLVVVVSGVCNAAVVSLW